MGVGISIIAASIVDILYELAIAGIGAITYLAATAGAITTAAATLAIDVGTAIIPATLAVLPYLITYAPALALSYFVYTNPILTATFVFTGIAVGGACVAATALAATQPQLGATDANNGLNNQRSPSEVQDELQGVLDYINAKEKLRSDIALYDKEVASSRFRSRTGEIVSNNVANRGLDFVLYFLEKRDQIAEAAKAFVESSAYYLRDTVQSQGLYTATRDNEPFPPWSYTIQDVENPRSARIRLKSKQRTGQSFTETCGVTLEDFLYGIATCNISGGKCPTYRTGKRNVSVRSNSRRNPAKRKVRVSDRSGEYGSVQPTVSKVYPKRKNTRRNSVRAVPKTTKRRGVGKQNKTMSRKGKK